MRTFRCDNCGHPLFFENVECLKCNSPLAFLPDRLNMAAIEKVDGVSLLEFGTPEAMWHLWVHDFPAIVTMDAHGNSLHKDLEDASGEKLAELRAVAAR